MGTLIDFTMDTKLNDAEIISMFLEKIDWSGNKLAKRLGYKSASTIYNILKDPDRYSITSKMAEKIVEIVPSANFLFLTRGELPILIEKSESIAQSHLLGLEQTASFDTIPETLKEILSVLREIRDKM